jgi:hypothetical protein
VYNLAKGLAIRILDSISCEGWSGEWMSSCFECSKCV